MAGFLAVARLSGDVAAALRSAGVALPDYARARLNDPAFHAACADVDEAERLSIGLAVRARAATGDPRALAALREGLGFLESDGGRPADDVPPHVAAAMLDAGYRALGLAVPDVPPPVLKVCVAQTCPECGHHFRADGVTPS